MTIAPDRPSLVEAGKGIVKLGTIPACLAISPGDSLEPSRDQRIDVATELGYAPDVPWVVHEGLWTRYGDVIVIAIDEHLPRPEH